MSAPVLTFIQLLILKQRKAPLHWHKKYMQNCTLEKCKSADSVVEIVKFCLFKQGWYE